MEPVGPGAVDATSINAFKSKLEGLRASSCRRPPGGLGGIPASEAAQDE